jgi:hypothetical protein
VQQQQEQNRQLQQRAQQQQDQNRQQQRGLQQGNRSSERGQRIPQQEERGVWQQHRASSWQVQHRTWQQRGGYSGYRIPQDRFRIEFGREHRFRVYSLPLVIYAGNPRFEYDGYWFTLLDPVPEYWPDDWYQSDDVYIDYSDDGYYLYNVQYPRDRVAVDVDFG